MFKQNRFGTLITTAELARTRKPKTLFVQMPNDI